MTCSDVSLADLSDDRLLAEVKRLAVAERRATAALILSLIELDARRLYLGEGYSSLFTYCTQALHLAEGSAYNRIEAARAARRFPLILELLDDGSLTVTAVRLLAPHLTVENHREVLASAQHTSKREVELLIASLNPKLPAPNFVRKVPERRREATVTNAPEPAPVCQSISATGEGQKPAAPRSVAEPLTTAQYKIQVTVSSETHDKLRRAQDLLRHAVPSGDPALILDRALTLLLDELERRRCAATTSPRTSRDTQAPSRHIPAAVKREVWKRDDGRCAFVGTEGRCRERGFLELHHVEPYAVGGEASAENIQLRCRAHNAFEASLYFGSGGAEVVREGSPNILGRCDAGERGDFVPVHRGAQLGVESRLFTKPGSQSRRSPLYTAGVQRGQASKPLFLLMVAVRMGATVTVKSLRISADGRLQEWLGRTERQVAPSPRTVIFDLDRTLISCDSFAGLLNSLLLRDWWRIVGVVAVSPLLVPLWAAPTTRPAALWGLLWCATVGLSSKEFACFVSAHARRLTSEAGSKIYRDGLHALMAHQRSGDRVVIVTGSVCDLATALCAALGLDDVRVVGSTLRSCRGGWVVDDHCVGAHKVAMLTTAGVTRPWAVVYTDSASDLPLLRLAERRCVVNARPGALRAVKRALGPGNYEILRWQ